MDRLSTRRDRKGEMEMELLPGLPEEIGVECLTRLPHSAHRGAAQVCRRWRELLESREFYHQRKRSGFTYKLACLVQALPVRPDPLTNNKPLPQPCYGISIFNPNDFSWERLNPVPKYPSGLPLFAQLSSVEGKLVVMGGWNPVSWEPVQDVFVYDFTIKQWRRGKNMPSNRSFFGSAGLGGKVFIAGGHDENKNALKSAWSYDVREDKWCELTQMSEERDECEGVVIGNEFCVVSGYGTDEQGKFKGSAEFYKPGTGQWRRVDAVWIEGRCPRGTVGVNRNRTLMCLTEIDSAVSIGTCGVELSELSFVSGSAYKGAKPGFYVCGKEGQKCKLEKIDVSDDFSGFVQSRCSVEI